MELGDAEGATVHDVPASGGLQVHVEQRFPAGIEGVPAGSRAVTAFLVNNRDAAGSLDEREATYAFQAELEARSDRPFPPRPDPRAAAGDPVVRRELHAGLVFAATRRGRSPEPANRLRQGSATSPATAPCRSLPSTNRSTAACPAS